MATNDKRDEYSAMVIEALPNTQFRVHVDGTPEDQLRIVYLAGKLKRNFIKVLVGDRVKVYLPTKDGIGRLTFRPRQEHGDAA